MAAESKITYYFRNQKKYRVISPTYGHFYTFNVLSDLTGSDESKMVAANSE